MNISKNKISLWKRIGETLLCIFIGAGIMYFYELFKNFNAAKADQLFMIIGFGIAYAYFLGYDSPLKGKKNIK